MPGERSASLCYSRVYLYTTGTEPSAVTVVAVQKSERRGVSPLWQEKDQVLDDRREKEALLELQ